MKIIKNQSFLLLLVEWTIIEWRKLRAAGGAVVYGTSNLIKIKGHSGIIESSLLSNSLNFNFKIFPFNKSFLAANLEKQPKLLDRKNQIKYKACVCCISLRHGPLDEKQEVLTVVPVAGYKRLFGSLLISFEEFSNANTFVFVLHFIVCIVQDEQQTATA